MQVLTIWALSLKMPINAPFGGVLGVKMGTGLSVTFSSFVPIGLQ